MEVIYYIDLTPKLVLFDCTTITYSILYLRIVRFIVVIAREQLNIIFASKHVEPIKL